MTRFMAAARLELAEVMRSRWLVFCGLVHVGLVAVFFLAGMRESALFGFTGTGRVLLSYTHALLLVLPLVALTATVHAIGRARDDGTLELLFGHPFGRAAWFAGVSLVRTLALIAPLVVVLPAAALIGQLAFGDPAPWAFVGRALLVCAALLVAFAGVGLAVSTYVRSQARATVYVILVWALGVALLDFGLIGVLLRWRVEPRVVFALAALNPVESARLALLSNLKPDLGTLGPVGFYLSTRVGAALLVALGAVWPAAVGVLAWLASLRRFCRTDVV
jgi:ABC-type transport system involved in multi-copper enzyme maturation permease subunit